MTDGEPPALETAGALPEESAEELYETAPCGYVSTTPGGWIVRVNQTLLDWTGYARDELVGRRRLQDVLTVGGRIFYETHLAPLLAMQDRLREIALDVRCKDGRTVPVLLNTDQKRDAAGQPAVQRSTLFNVTDRKEYERELLQARKKAEQAAQAKADFISMVSHEIRTPLNAILGVAHLLGNTSPTPPQQKYLRILRSSSEALLALINDVLDFSKIEAGKVALEERPFDPRDLVASIAQSLGVKADEKQVEMRIEIDETLPTWLLGDLLKLRQVLTNLVGNAIKFTAKGYVALRLRVIEARGDRVAVTFEVADTGIGIAADRLALIFEEFSQASYDVSVKFGGTGLGLAICRKLLELFGATMTVQSEPGKGSTFGFTLRLAVAPADAVAAAPRDGSEHDATELRGLRVLIADDNDVNRFVLGGFLRKWSVEYDVVENGQQAVDRVGAAAYDVVLMDLRMPELDGYGATRQIRERPDARLRALPIIATSASIRIGEEQRLVSSGFTDFIGKPVSPDVLFRMLRKYARPA